MFSWTYMQVTLQLTYRLFYQIAFSEEVAGKFKGITGSKPIMRISQSQAARGPNLPSFCSKGKRKENSKFFIDFEKNQIMENKEETESVKRVETPKSKNRVKNVISKAHPASKYEQIIYNRGSLSIVLPDRIEVKDVLFYPTADKRDSPVFFKNEKIDKEFLWSNDLDPDVIIDQEIDL